MTRRDGTGCGAFASLDIVGFDFIACIDFHITSWGCDARTYGPPEDCYPAEGPEYEIDAIMLREDFPGALGPAWEATGAMFDVLANLPAVVDAIDEAISEARCEREYWRRRKYPRLRYA